MSKAYYPLLCGWASSNQLKAWIKQKGQPSYKQQRIPLAWWQELNWDISFFSLTSNANWNISSSWIPRMPAFKLELYHRFSVLQACTRTKPSVLLGLQITNSFCSSWDLPASPNYVTQIPNNKYLSIPSPTPYTHTHTHTHTIASVSLENPKKAAKTLHLSDYWNSLFSLLSCFSTSTSELIPILHACYKFINNV